MLTICTATLKDYLAVNNLVKEGHEEHVREMPAVFKSVSSVMPEDYYRELLESSNSTIFIAKNQEEVIGFAVVSIESAPSFDSLVQRRYAYIHDFGVKKIRKNKVLANYYLQLVLTGPKRCMLHLSN
ncbi:GNAT family N-acetyltransferase [Metasolibacillus meyeri]|uniref:GNAT family N-acetyltransferase n=1 Tax=Metasolibacillus meyeri TaxID=1071052 RepID=UPI001EE71A14|nr:GNAT family N-acetyltransferase [Metasolibacillus meyeri]